MIAPEPHVRARADLRFAKTRGRTASPSGSRRRSERVSGFERKAPKTRPCWRDRREKNKARVDVAPHDPETKAVHY